MIKIMHNFKTKDKAHHSLYRRLCIMSCSIKRVKLSSESKDVGSGKFPRHQVSNNIVLSESDVEQCIALLNIKFAFYTREMNKIKHNKGYCLLNHFKLYHSLQSEIKKAIPGIGPFRAIHLISFASLIGMLPYEYHTSIPMHTNGGPGLFMTNEVDWNRNQKQSDLDHWTVSTMKQLQEMFTSEFTPNMFENCLCILSRKMNKSDIFYLLPWYNHLINELTEDKIQLCFRVNGFRKNKWELQLFDGVKVQSINANKQEAFTWNKRKDQLILDRGHKFDMDFWKNLYVL